eukprot:11687165-Prorocentrum_lima.AAC.1
MTSSLVGSEMCIRDRTSFSSSMRVGGSGARRVGGPTAAGGEIRSDRCSAVSYTHLTLPTICSV